VVTQHPTASQGLLVLATNSDWLTVWLAAGKNSPASDEKTLHYLMLAADAEHH